LVRKEEKKIKQLLLYFVGRDGREGWEGACSRYLWYWMGGTLGGTLLCCATKCQYHIVRRRVRVCGIVRAMDGKSSVRLPLSEIGRERRRGLLGGWMGIIEL